MLNRIKEMIERKSKNVSILIDENIPKSLRKIFNDSFHLHQTLANIIENAYNNTENGFV